MRTLLPLAAVLALAAACALWPLAIWAFTLAAFGVPHALVEMRWVGRRYGRWRALVPAVLTVLTLVAVLRLLAFPFRWSMAANAIVEIGLGILLVTCVLPREVRHCATRCGVATVVIAALAFGLSMAPIDTLLILAIAHNLTPLGFVADRLRDEDGAPRERARWCVAAILCFLVLPVWLATGMAAVWFDLDGARSTVLDANAASGLGIGLRDGLGAFTPSWFPAERSLDLLRACAFLQCMHYIAVLVVLPRLGPGPHSVGTGRVGMSWDRPFVATAGGLGAVFLVAFVLDFREAKATYGVLAAVHVWMEFPALLLALTPRAHVPSAP